MKNLLLIFFTIFSFLTFGQISYSQNWSATGLNSWTSQNGFFSRTTQMICATTASVRANIYSTNATGNFASPLLSGNNGGLVTVSYLYKVINYSSPNGATPATFGTLKVQYASALAGPWTDVPGSTVNSSNHSPSTSCQTRVVQFTPALGNVYIRFNVSWSTGDYYMYFDDVTISQGSAPSCTSPTSLTSSSIATTTATISWTAASPAPSSGYQYFLSTSSSAPTAGTTPTGSTAAGVTSVNLSSLNSGTQYYFWVRSNCGGSQSSWAGSSTFTTTIPPPSNDACSGATNLPCGTSGLAGTTVGAVSETAPNASTLGTMGVWYSFAGTDQQTTITVVQSLDTRLLVLTSSTGACGGTYTTIANVDNITSSNETATFAANSGTTYFVYIGYYTNGTNTGTFTISRSCTTPPSNNNCSGATALTVNTGSSCTTSTNGTTVGATQSSTACSGTADDDVWYSFVANGNRQTLTVTPGTLTNAVLQVYSGSCAGLVSLACVNNTTGSSAETVTVEGLVAGTTYFVRVHSNGNGTGQGTFTICATTPCTTPTVAGTLAANKTSTTVNDAVVYTTSGNAGSITKLEWSYDNFATVAGTQNNPANPFTMWLNVQQSIVYVRTTSVSGNCPAGVTTPVAVNLSLAPEYVYGTSSNDYITNVTLNTINNNSTYDAPQGYDSYQDFTSISTTLVKGSTYTISVSSTMTYLNYSGYVAWIDYNNNGIFEVSENIMQQAPGATRSQSFTVPSTASTALVTLRVLSAWGETPSTDAYYSVGYDWGEIEEYKINVTSGLPVELSIFNGVNQGKDNHLYWVTSSEQNTSHFNLQKSRDGETWETVVTLNAAGNSNTQIDYDVVDYKVEPIINYYRLQQYDNDGIYETFGPISINNMNLGTQKTIVKYINLNGQEIDPNKLNLMDVYIEVYDDGTMRKVIKS
jgi:hypothetical protein